LGAISRWALTNRSTGAPNSGAVGFPPRTAQRRPVNGGVMPNHFNAESL